HGRRRTRRCGERIEPGFLLAVARYAAVVDKGQLLALQVRQTGSVGGRGRGRRGRRRAARRGRRAVAGATAHRRHEGSEAGGSCQDAIDVFHSSTPPRRGGLSAERSARTLARAIKLPRTTPGWGIP